MAERPRSPLDAVGSMPSLPAGWDLMPVQQNASKPLAPGHRWPLTFYRQATVADVNAVLWSEGA